MTKIKEKNQEIVNKNKNDLRELEQFYTTNKVDTMFKTIENKKQELIQDMIQYADEHTIPCAWDKEGNPTSYKVKMNPLVITNYFFKPITPITSQEPIYNAEKLGMVFDYYCDILANVNDKIGDFPSSLTSFCKLAESMISQGGIVYGSSMQKENGIMTVKHKRAEKIEELKQFQGSKYVQSDMTDAFIRIRNDLLQGKKVLFSGSPCQNAALKKFLSKEYNNLYTVEIICHGVPNLRLFQDFIKYYEKKLGGSIEEFYFRDKSKGQGYITKTIYTAKDNSKQIKIKPGEQFAYIRFFSKSLTLRENCYKCPYAGENRVADITIGDFWGFNDVHPEMKGNDQFTEMKGISCVLVNSERGLDYLSKCKNDFYLLESSFEKVQKHNEQLKAPTVMPAIRKNVLDTYASKGYEGLEKFYSRKFLKDRVEYKVAEYLPRDLKSRIRKMISK